MQGLGGMGGRLKILNNDAETFDRSRVIAPAQVEASYFHFLGRQMIKCQIELQRSTISIFAAWITLNDISQRFQRFNRQSLIPANVVDLVIIAERQQIGRIGRIRIGGVEIEIALRRAARRVIVPPPVE